MSTTSDSEIDTGTNFVRTRNTTGHSMTSLQKISLAITFSLEKFFYRWGFMVATHPIKAISSCLLLSIVCGLGIVNFSIENRPDRLWIPRNSELAQNTEWLRKSFPSPIRTSFSIITAENVLKPDVMRVILDIHERVQDIEVSGGKYYRDLCYKLPITKFLSRRRKRETEGDKESVVKEDQGLLPLLETDLNINQTSHDDRPHFVTASFEDAFDDEFFTHDDDDKLAHHPSSQKGGFSHLFNVPDELYCSLVKELDESCLEVNPCELWTYDRNKIDNLTQEEIIRVVNHELISPIFGRSVNYTVEFGNIVRNEIGEMISAGSVLLRWAVGINQTALDSGLVSDRTGDIVDDDCLEWEVKWIKLMKNISAELPPGINAYFVNSQSWMEISEATIFDDGLTLIFGLLIMSLYVGIMLGRFNVIEQRPFLTIAGLSSVGLSCIISYGLCSLCSIVYGPVNKILPFLLLGIGIDDIFVIKQCWDNLFPSPLTCKKKSKLSIPEKMGACMKHAGVSITVTSLTDVAAFTVGASTILPGLSSFCIYAAVGIVAIFVLQSTYFVAWFALDQRRVEDRRNAFFMWIKHKDDEFIPNSWSDKSYLQTFFDNVLSKYLFTKWAKAIVISFTFGLLGITIYGNTLLKQQFDPMWFLPSDSYMSQYVDKREMYYPGTGYPAFLVASQVNWSESFETFDKVLHDLKSTNATYNIENWYDDFKEYSNNNFHANIPERALTPAKFQKYMGKFLYSPAGSKHRPYFKYDGNFSCGESLPPLKTVVMPFRFRKFDGPQEHIPALLSVNTLLKTANKNMTFNAQSTPKFFIWGTGLVAWETDIIINAELYRNISLSLLCVLVTTFLLLANFRVCFLCGLCVIFTLVNVGGFMHFWGLTIDTVSCIDVVLGIGLCVDYAAHIALAFMTCTGTRESRAKQALSNIGVAVFQGGVSTFLAIVLLANSKSHAFQSFFKIFTVVIISGLFHGLIFLPVLLSFVGPEPYPFAYSRDKDDENDEFNGFNKSKSHPKVVEMKPLHQNNTALLLDDMMDSDGGVRKDVKTDPNDSLPIFSTNNAPLLIGPRDIESFSTEERTQH